MPTPTAQFHQQWQHRSTTLWINQEAHQPCPQPSWASTAGCSTSARRPSARRTGSPTRTSREVGRITPGYSILYIPTFIGSAQFHLLTLNSFSRFAGLHNNEPHRSQLGTTNSGGKWKTMQNEVQKLARRIVHLAELLSGRKMR